MLVNMSACVVIVTSNMLFFCRSGSAVSHDQHFGSRASYSVIIVEFSGIVVESEGGVERGWDLWPARLEILSIEMW